jgi:hypothetical protein
MDIITHSLLFIEDIVFILIIIKPGILNKINEFDIIPAKFVAGVSSSQNPESVYGLTDSSPS